MRCIMGMNILKVGSSPYYHFPTKEVEIEQASSQHVTAPLVTRIVEQDENISDIKEEMKQRKREAHNSKCKHQQEAVTTLKSELPAALLRSAELATEEGASSWLTAILLDRYSFTLHKGAYRDALCLRYGWSPPMLASQCVCGQLFTIAQPLSCPTGGYPSIRHNELRDITADLLKEVCSDITVEPPLQPLTGKVLSMRTSIRGEEARLDISAKGFWGGQFERAFFDVRVFNPSAPTNRSHQLTANYRRHEQEKRRAYEQCVREVERASFTPLVFAASGGMGKAATVFYKRLVALLAQKQHKPYSTTMGWLCTALSFTLLRSAVLYLQGSRTKRSPPVSSNHALDLMVSEDCLGHWHCMPSLTLPSHAWFYWQRYHDIYRQCACVPIVLHCLVNHIIISGLLRIQPKWPTQWNYSVLVWDAGKPYRFQTWPEDRGYTVYSNNAIICNCVNWRFHTSFVFNPYVYIAPKWFLLVNSVTYN